MSTKMLGPTPRLTIHITPEILERTLARNSNHCAIAEAVKEANPEFKAVSVDLQTIRATDKKKGERYIWLTPRSLQTLLIEVDQGRKEKITPRSALLRDGQTVQSGKIKSVGNRERKMRRPKNGNQQSVPVVVGGRAPPRIIGRRRAFGLRGLEL